jgi:hypothetical protein
MIFNCDVTSLIATRPSLECADLEAPLLALLTQSKAASRFAWRAFQITRLRSMRA